MSNEVKIASAVGVAVVLLLAGVTYFAVKAPSTSPSSTNAVPLTDLADAGQLTRSDSYAKGDENAKVTVVEFGDYQCPACEASYPIVEQTIASYKGKGVQFVFRNYPLPQHTAAQLAATAAEAAGDQGKFWEMYDMLYANQSTWTADPPANKSLSQSRTIFKEYAKNLGLDQEKFDKALDTRAFNTKIGTDLADANKLGVSATPTFYVNGEKATEGASELASMIDAALAK